MGEGKGESYRLKDRSLKPMIDEMCKIHPGEKKGFKVEDDVPAPFIGEKGFKKFNRSMDKHMKDVDAAKRNVSESYWDFLPDFGITTWFQNRWKSIPFIGGQAAFRKDFENFLDTDDYKNAADDSTKAALLQKFASKNRGFLGLNKIAGMHSFRTMLPTKANYEAKLWNKLHAADEANRNGEDNFVETFREEGHCIEPDKTNLTGAGKIFKKFRTDKFPWRSHWGDNYYENDGGDCLAEIEDTGRATAMVRAAEKYAAKIGCNNAPATDEAKVLKDYHTELGECKARWNRAKYFVPPKTT